MNGGLILLDGVLLLVRGDAEGEPRYVYLGEPRDSLYNDVPEALWPDLERAIADYREALEYGRECRKEVDESHQRRQR